MEKASVAQDQAAESPITVTVTQDQPTADLVSELGSITMTASAAQDKPAAGLVSEADP